MIASLRLGRTHFSFVSARSLKSRSGLTAQEAVINKQLEQLRSDIEKCFGAFQNKFRRFDKKTPFHYNKPIFDITISISSIFFLWL